MEHKFVTKTSSVSRRQFIKHSAAVSLATFAGGNRIYAAGSDVIKVGLVGCGDRGTHDARKCVQAAEGVRLTAMADIFQDKLDRSLAQLSRSADDQVSVSKETCFTGFDSYKKLLETDVDVVILATPPHFRPAQLKAALESGKHVFMEKPLSEAKLGG